SSSADSISPEPLSDSLMPPPPPKNKAAPRPETGDSAKRVKPEQNEVAKKPQNGVAPVTPASLMNISNPTPARDKAGDTPMGEAVLTVASNDEVVANDNGKASKTSTGDGQGDAQGTLEEEQPTPKLSS